MGNVGKRQLEKRHLLCQPLGEYSYIDLDCMLMSRDIKGRVQSTMDVAVEQQVAEVVRLVTEYRVTHERFEKVQLDYRQALDAMDAARAAMRQAEKELLDEIVSNAA